MKLADDSTEGQQPAPVYRNRQTFIGLIVRPKQQTRAAMAFIAGVWVANLALAGLIVPNAATIEGREIAIYLGVSALALSVFAIVTGVVFTHRLYGPLVSIKRHIANLREGQYSSRLALRSTDDLGEMRDALNDLASALESRHGSGPRAPS